MESNRKWEEQAGCSPWVIREDLSEEVTFKLNLEDQKQPVSRGPRGASRAWICARRFRRSGAACCLFL